jgi:hypothetical protein
MGKSSISMAMFNSYVKLPEGINVYHVLSHLNGISARGDPQKTVKQ